MPNKRRDLPEYKLMLRALERGPMCARDLSIELGITVRNARCYLKLANAFQTIYISDWVKHDRGPWFPVYTLGRGKDKPSPPEQTLADIREADRIRSANRRKDVEKWLSDRNAKRAKRSLAEYVRAR